MFPSTVSFQNQFGIQNLFKLCTRVWNKACVQACYFELYRMVLLLFAKNKFTPIY